MPPIDDMPSSAEKKTGRAYWRSLDDLADTPEFREMVSREFADYSPEQVVASPSRRGFMKLMGASMALAGVGGVTGCRRWPESKVLPYVERPEGRIPGVPERFATVMELGGVARPLLVSSFDGRPTKVEGNPSHPQSRGASDSFSQASVLDMYDPDRSRYVLREGERSSWRAFAAGLDALEPRGNGGAGFAILSEATSSPSIAALRGRIAEAMPNARWFEYEPINRDNELEGARLAFGRAVRPQLKLGEAEVIVTLDADILGMHPASLEYAREWAAGRRPGEGEMNRLWSIDSRFTVTSSNADRRLPVRSSRIGGVVRALAAELGVAGLPAGGSGELDEGAAQFVRELAADLGGHAGGGVLVAGPSQPPEVHAAAWLINEHLGNIGETVVFTEEPIGEGATHVRQIERLVGEMNEGGVRTLLILGGNPVYDAPVDLDFLGALAKVENSIHLSQFEDETSAACTVHLPRSHYLESWGDARSWDGTISVRQPLIYPLYHTKSAIEVLAMIAGDEAEEGLEIVRRTARQYLPGGGSEKAWREALREGLVEGSGFEEITPQPSAGAAGRIAEAMNARGAGGDLELVLTADYSVYDGRFATNGWLQELPDPLTKVTWDNAALIGLATAGRLGVGQNDLVRLSVGEGEDRRSVDAAVYLMPGQAEGSISIALGYGRGEAGYIGTGVGFDAYQVRTTEAMHVAVGVEVTNLGVEYELVTTQNHHVIDRIGMEEREERAFGELIRSATREEYEDYREHGHGHGDFSIEERVHIPSMKSRSEGIVPLQLWDEPQEYEDGHKWGMAIDLNSCTGCSACVIACQAENNVPIVGKEEVGNGREMHWLRVDRYFGGDKENPRAAHQPMLCQHCENAPCESVCPVAATVHDSEGLNVMVYNRCIGVRYCSNNCPYKVRRFNWFDWHAKPVKGAPYTGTYLGPPDQQQLTINPIRQMQFHPEVTVRMRGVMEKCTFCLQRIKAATIPARNAYALGERETDRVPDGAITPACAQACPTQAIIFGDLNDPTSRVARYFHSDRAYEVLKELNVRNRIRYQARITNPGGGGEPAGADMQREEHG